MTTKQSTEMVLANQDADRFWRKVRKTRTCWLWTGAGSGNGSGYFKPNGKTVKASHISWQIANGESPAKGMFVAPTCGNKKCVRPDHLQLQRGKLSADRRSTKLAPEQVEEIRRRSKTEGVSQRQLAAAYGVSQQAIQKILSGNAWKATATEKQSLGKQAPGKSSKPDKPYTEFPLTAHPSGRWCKKILGKLHYFGPWHDWQGALEKLQRQRDDLYAGRKPRDKTDGVSVRELCNRFLTAKQARRDNGEISPLTFGDYHRTCGRIVRVFGKSRVVDDLDGDDFDELRVFLTQTGRSWYKESTTYLSEQFRRFVKGIDTQEKARMGEDHSPLYRRGVGFYTLRHVFETIAGESRDQVAVDFIMGHERGDMASVYRERISDERLIAVTDCVHTWLFDSDGNCGKAM